MDAATWTPDVSPGPAPPAGTAFFSERTRPEDVLVAEVEGVVVGYTKLSQSIALPSHDHVLTLNGLAVDPQRQRHGAGRRLVEAAVQEAQGRGAQKLGLRVLGSNTSARLLYEVCGFVVEGILRAQFLLNGRYVDDVLMARQLTPEQQLHPADRSGHGTIKAAVSGGHQFRWPFPLPGLWELPEKQPMSGRFSAGDPTSVPHSLAVACAHDRLVAVTEPSLDVMALSTNIWLASPSQLPPAPGLAETIAFEQNPTGMSS